MQISPANWVVVAVAGAGALASAMVMATAEQQGIKQQQSWRTCRVRLHSDDDGEGGMMQVQLPQMSGLRWKVYVYIV